MCRASISHDGVLGSLIVKRMSRARARRVELAMQRWLPAIGMGDIPPALLGTVAPADAPKVWHIYEDVGEVTLEQRQAEAEPVAAAAVRIAELHVRGAAHPLAAECRAEGKDFGIRYFLTAVGDAQRVLDGLGGAHLSGERARVRDGLRRHVDALLVDAARRARVSSEAGGPETLLHGDLGPANVVVPEDARTPVRLIDWDHAGAGPAAHDLSTFLLHFPPPDRPRVLRAYRDAVGRAGHQLPPDRELNVLFDTAARARCASRIVECAIALRQGDVAWWHDALAEVLRWLDALTPVLPEH